MAATSCWVSGIPNKLLPPNPNPSPRSSAALVAVVKGNSREAAPSAKATAEVPDRYKAFVDPIDGYSYIYPSDWRDFEFTGCDSAFKDRNVALQHVRVSFVPTEKKDVNDLGQIEEVVPSLVKTVYAAPTQTPTILDMQERNIDGKNYWTFEYVLQSPTFGRTAFATIAIGNGRYYTLVVGANERRWTRVRNQLRAVADSFRLVDI
ncbi:unnamed protein product [Spirodela intermedia]|uniref:PsbP C-terminal domain-containing protein n=1 Tax=Spirodela intermedia TaxID=51605 RepID=A0A7I8KL19_SPIIN|nr:unnamed protein product [Spirodela intermedia]